MKKNLFSFFIALMLCVSAIAQTTILFEDFQSTSGSAIPSTWSQQTAATDGGWKTGTALGSQYWTVPAHTKYAATNDDACNCDKSLDRLKTPVLDFSAYSKIFMTLDILFFEGTYQSATEEAKIEISTDGGNNFSTLQQLTAEADWYTLEIDLSNYAGQSNVVIAFNYNDAGDWLFGWAIDNFKIFEPAQLDAGVTSADMQDYVAVNVPQTIQGNLKNFGATAITSLDLNYSVNGSNPVTQNLTGINIASLASFNYTHSSTWTPSATGTYTIKVWTSNINGNADPNPANDTAIKTVVVVSQVATRVSLVEHFTSSTCAPCAAEANAVHAFYTSNNANAASTQLAVIKYQMNWPSPGNDPSYNPEGNSRKSYYGVSAVPTKFIDGIESEVAQQDVDAAKAIPAIMDVDVSFTVNGNAVDVTAIVTPYATISATTKLHIIVIEEYYNYPGAATSQKDYYWVQRKMLPNSNGSIISPLTEGVAKTINQSYTFTVQTPPTQGTYALWVGTNNIKVIAFVQDNASKKIYQAGISGSSAPLSASTTTTIASTGQCDGTATVYALGGNPSYTYSWSTSPAQTTQTATGLCAGNYSVTVTDNTGATVTSTVTVNQVLALSANATVVSNTSDDVNCNGSATVTASGGTPPYTYSWGTTPAQITQTATGLCAGDYDVTVTDNASGTFIDSVTITSTVGIEESLLNNEIQLFPNPSKGVLFVQFNSKLTENAVLVITDILGKTVHKENISTAVASIVPVDLNKLSNGLYFVNVRYNNGTSLFGKLVLEK